MKKLYLSIVSVLLCGLLFLSACAPGVHLIGLLERVPWSSPGNFVREVSVYDIARYMIHLDGEDEVRRRITDTSRVTYTLTQGYSLNFSFGQVPTPVPNYSFTLLEVSLETRYLHYDFIDPLIRNTVQRIHAFAVFDSFSLAAKFTFRHAQMGDIIEGGVPQTRNHHKMWVDYTRQSARLDTLDTFGNIITQTTQRIRNIGADRHYYDNEYLFFFLRALRSTGHGNAATAAPEAGTQSFEFFLPFECLLADRRVRARELIQETAALAAAPYPGGLNRGFLESRFNIPASVFAAADQAAAEELENNPEAEPGFNPLIAQRTTLRLSDARRGPDIVLYYSIFPTTRLEVHNHPALPQVALNKVLLQFRTYTFGIRGNSFDTRTPLYTQVFTLTEYNNHI